MNDRDSGAQPAPQPSTPLGANSVADSGDGAQATTVSALLGELAMLLDAAGIPDPGREARDIIAALRDAPRFWTTVNGHTVMSANERALARAAATRRALGAPFAYAVRSAASRRRTSAVATAGLTPRPATERLVQIVL